MEREESSSIYFIIIIYYPARDTNINMSRPIIEAIMLTILANILPALYLFNLPNCLGDHCIKLAPMPNSAIIINGDMKERIMYNMYFIAVIFVSLV